MRHTTWKHPEACLAVFLSDVPRTHTHFFLRLPEFAVRAHRRIYGSPSPCAPCLAGAHSSGDRAAPTMTRVEDGREMNALPENRYIWGGPVNAARSTGRESFLFFFFSFCFKGPSSSSRVASVWRGGGAKKKKKKRKEKLFCMQSTGRMKSGIYFSTLSSSDLANAACFCLKEEACVCVGRGRNFSLPLSLFSTLTVFLVCLPCKMFWAPREAESGWCRLGVVVVVVV